MTARLQVTGIGGVFFRARDPAALAAWYREHLGVPVAPDGTHAAFSTDVNAGDAGGSPLMTVWSAFPADTEYFGPEPAGWMVNYRVADLDGMLAQLRAAGVRVTDVADESEYGRFAWGTDPEGTRFELWEPPAPPPASPPESNS